MDVAGRRETAHLARLVDVRSGLDEDTLLLVQAEKLLVLDALDDAEHAPRDVVVNLGHLPGPPDQRDDREGSVGVRVEDVAAKSVRVAAPLLQGEHVGGREAPAQRGGHEAGGLAPVRVARHDGADRGHQLVQAGRQTARQMSGRAHRVSLVETARTPQTHRCLLSLRAPR
jgi:hypothetical protein